MSDVYGMIPINKTAAVVTSQKNCSEQLTAEQKRASIIDHIRQIEEEIKTLKKSDKKRKKLGVRKFELQQEISKLNKSMGKIGIGESNRSDFADCVFDVLRDNLSPFEYKRIIRLAEELYKETLIQLEKGE